MSVRRFVPTPGPRTWRVALPAIVLVVVLLAPTSVAWAGGGPENVVLIVDPSEPDALYVANHYRAARGIPERNVLYMPPGADDYQAFVDTQLPALLGTIAQRGLDDHVDYVVVPPGSPFYVSTPDLIDGGDCPAPVRRLAISAAYGLAYEADEILEGGLTYSEANRYFGKGFMANDDPLAFDSRTAWLNGEPSEAVAARRYFLGFMLGYSGERGNTVADTIAMIDRSVGADGTHPDGTFYFMRTDDVRSTPRHPHFSTTIRSIENLGGQAEEIYKVDDTVAIVPDGHHDVLGVMTGHAVPDIDGADMTLLPGTFADHLTSYAATFDTSGQRKMSRWIANGASGTMGTVEEPCVFGTGVTGKFPHPQLQAWYLQGMSLGEALFRSLQWAPFQSLFYGDPLTRPHATFPTVRLVDAPTGPVSGTVTLLAEAASANPDVDIERVDVLADGVRYASVPAGGVVALDSTALADGPHDLRLIAFEETDVRTQGRWLGTLDVDNHALSAEVVVSPTGGDLATVFDVMVSAAGGDVTEIRLIQGGRVIAASPGERGAFRVPATLLGAGEVAIAAVAETSDGRLANSTPVRVVIAPEGTADPAEGPEPTAFDYTAYVWPDHPVLLDLPAVWGGEGPPPREIVTAPTQAVLEPSGAAFLLRPDAGAAGEDALVFRVVTGTLSSAPATVRLRYCQPPRVQRDPSDTSVCAGGRAVMTAAATGDHLRYQWLRDGMTLAGATGPRLVIRGASPADAGTYAVEVWGHCGTGVRRALSQPATLSIVDDPSACRHDVWLPLAETGRGR